MSLESILTRDIATIDIKCRVLEAAKKMAEARIGVLMVTEKDKIVGIFSERDVLNRVVAKEKDPATLTIGEVATLKLITVPLDISPTEALSIMTSNRIRHLPVTQGGAFIGIISIRDIMEGVVNHLSATLST